MILIIRNLSVEDFGVFSYLLNFIGLTIGFVAIFSSVTVYLQKIKKDGDTEESFYSTFLTRTTFFLLVFLFFAASSRFFIEPKSIISLYFLIAAFGLDFLRDFFLARLEAKNAMHKETIVLMVQALILLFQFIRVPGVSLRIEYLSISYLFSSVIGISLAILFERISHTQLLPSQKKIQWTNIKNHILTSLHFGMLWAFVLTLFPQFLISVAGLAKQFVLAGSLNTYLSIQQILLVPPALLMSASFPTLANFDEHSSFSARAKKLAEVCLAFSLPVAIGGAFVGNQLVFALFHKTELFLPHFEFVFLSLPFFYAIILFLYLILIKQKIQKAIKTLFLPMIFIYPLSAWVIYKLPEAITFILFLFSVMIALFLYVFLKKEQNDPRPDRSILPILLSTCLMGFFLSILLTLHTNLWIIIFVSALLYAGCFYALDKKMNHLRL